MLCVSLLKDKTRCPNKKIGDSYHCDLHREKAKSLYLKYKQLQKQCEELDLDNNNVEYIEKCYVLFNRAYKAREKHRSYAFNEEYWDEGHNYQFTKLMIQMEQCETILEKLYDINNTITENVIEDNHEQMKEIIKEHKVIDLIKYWKDYREKSQEECNNYINKCIQENDQYNKEKERLIVCLNNSLVKLYYDVENSKIIFYDLVVMEKKLIELFGNNFMEKKLQPDVYQASRIRQDLECDDDDLQMMNVLVLQFIDKLVQFDYFNVRKWSITKIVLEADRTNLQSYFVNLTNNQLKNIFELIIYRKKEIQYLIPLMLMNASVGCIVNKEDYVFITGFLDKKIFFTGESGESFRLIPKKELGINDSTAKLKYYLTRKY